MRVLLLDQFGEIGGAQRGLIEAAQGFAARGWTVHAAAPEGPVHAKLKPLCATLADLPCGPFQPVRKTTADAIRFGMQFRLQTVQVRQICETHGIDILYVNGPRLVPAASRASGSRPVVFHAHSLVTQPIAAALTRRFLRACHGRAIASSKFAGSWLHGCGPVQVIYNGIAGWGERPTPRRYFDRVGVLGRIAPEKGQIVFARAARIATFRNLHLRFVIAGGPVIAGHGYMYEVLSAAGPETSFTPWMDDAGEFFRNIDLLVVPSGPTDTNPRVIVEAFASGVPVIAFDGGGIPELIDHRQTGLLVRERTPEALAGAILEAVNKPGELNAIAERAYARWQQSFTLARFQSELCDALEEAVRGAPSMRASATA